MTKDWPVKSHTRRLTGYLHGGALWDGFKVAVSKLETIVEELKTLPPDRLDSAAGYIHRLKTIGSAERMTIIKAHGGFTDS